MGIKEKISPVKDRQVAPNTVMVRFIPALGALYVNSKANNEAINEIKKNVGATNTTTYQGSHGDTLSAKMLTALAEKNINPVTVSGNLVGASIAAHEVQRGEFKKYLHVVLADQDTPEKKFVLQLDPEHPSGQSALRKLINAKANDEINCDIFSRYEPSMSEAHSGKYFTNVCSSVAINGTAALANPDLMANLNSKIDELRKSIVSSKDLKLDEKTIRQLEGNSRKAEYMKIAEEFSKTITQSFSADHDVETEESAMPSQKAIEEHDEDHSFGL